MADDFDKLATVVDWLDACRSRSLAALLDFYAESASLECACEDIRVSDRSGLAAYWRPKLAGASADAFTLEGISPHGEGVALDYLSFECLAERTIALAQTASSARGVSGWIDRARGVSPVATRRSRASVVPPSWGGRPVRISKRMAPSP